MKKYILLMAVVLVGLTGYAQENAQEELAKRVETLENKVAQQDAQLSQLATDLNAALSQNLALKKNLNLKPTVAKAKTPSGIEYRILEVKGDPISHEIHLVMTIENVGNVDVNNRFYPFDILDELGAGYNNNNQVQAKIDGVSNSIVYEQIPLHINAPYTVNITIKGYNPDASYIKYLMFEVACNGNRDKVEFKNLPIKWVEED